MSLFSLFAVHVTYVGKNRDGRGETGDGSPQLRPVRLRRGRPGKLGASKDCRPSLVFTKEDCFGRWPLAALVSTTLRTAYSAYPVRHVTRNVLPGSGFSARTPNVQLLKCMSEHALQTEQAY